MCAVAGKGAEGGREGGRGEAVGYWEGCLSASEIQRVLRT